MPRPSKPMIVRDVAVKTALELIDEEGLDGFGMEVLAVRLGVRAPSLYHHFRGKADILQDVARLVTREAAVPPDPANDDWQSWFVDMSTNFRRSVLRHPKTAPLLLEFFPRGLGFTLSTYERGARLLERVGVPVELHAMIFEGLDKLTFGSALFGAAQLSAGEIGLFPSLDPDRDPALIQAVDSNRWPDQEHLFRQTALAFLYGAVALNRTGSAVPGSRNGRRRTVR